MSHHSDVQFDFNYMLADKIDSEHGLTIAEIEATFASAQEIQKALYDLRRLGQLPVQDLPFQEEQARNIREAGRRISEKFEDIVVLGIGGSALGPACLHDFLGTQLKIIDNVDPLAWQELERTVKLDKTFFIVISKSGTTVETLAAFAYFREKLIQQVGKSEYKNNLAIITDPEAGPLRDIARQEDILSFAIPPGVGGRYSVLSPVGLFPAACVGVDIDALLAGARTMDEHAQRTDLWINPPYLAAILSFLSASQKGKSMRILMPYAEALETFTEWFAQLWAESLGKRRNLAGEDVFAGSTPIRTMGATDQHSQLQLYLDGPRDKIMTFYTVRDSAKHKIPQSYAQYDELRELAGKNVKELLNIEYRATEQAVRRHGIPSMTLQLPRYDAATLGQLFYFAEMETIVTGQLLNINPFDQPAVESIKKYIKALLGVKGFEKELKEIEGARKDKRYII